MLETITRYASLDGTQTVAVSAYGYDPAGQLIAAACDYQAAESYSTARTVGSPGWWICIATARKGFTSRFCWREVFAVKSVAFQEHPPPVRPATRTTIEDDRLPSVVDHGAVAAFTQAKAPAEATYQKAPSAASLP